MPFDDCCREDGKSASARIGKDGRLRFFTCEGLRQRFKFVLDDIVGWLLRLQRETLTTRSSSRLRWLMLDASPSV